MPANKSAMLRYMLIDNMLRRGRRASLWDIIHACRDRLDMDISERTILQDISDMRNDRRLGFSAPIKNKDGYYYYSEEDYSIFSANLNEEEATSMLFFQTFLEQFRDTEIYADFRGAIQRLIDGMEVYFRQHITVALENKVQIEKVPEMGGSEYLDTVLDALANRIVLEVRYRSFVREREKTHFISPYLLKEYRNRWYVIGYNVRYRQMATYALDRITGLGYRTDRQFEEVYFDPEEYYRHAVGITVRNSKEPLNIRLSFTPFQARYVETLPLHESQELVKKNDDEVIFKYHLIPNFEFTSRILGWGDQVKVLSPASYRKEIIRALHAALGRYLGQ